MSNKDIQQGSLYITDLEDKFMGSIINEVMYNINQTFVYYWQLDESRTQISETYGEGTLNIFKNPVKIFCYVEFDEPTVNRGLFQVDEEKRITAYMHRRVLKEKGIIIAEDDFIEYGEFSYKIVSAPDTRYVGGITKFKDTIQVTAILPKDDKGLRESQIG